MTQTKAIVLTDPTKLIELAISKDADIDKLEKLMGLQERYLERLAKGAFIESMSIFQSECPVLKKTKTINFTPRNGGGQVNYNYTPLGEIANAIKGVLKKNGFSYRWAVDDKDGKIGVTCIVSHKDGHTEQTSMSAGLDDTGAKNVIQQRGSTITYLQRYTLIGVLGISTADSDLDATQPQPPKQKDNISELRKGAIVAIKASKTLDELKVTWAKYKSLQDDAEFAKAKDDKKKKLTK